MLYAAGNRAERERHAVALEIVRGADAGQLPVLVIPDVVLVETMNGLHRDTGAENAREMLRRLEAGANFKLVREPRAVWAAGLEHFRNHQRLSLADAVQVASARHHGVAAIYSFDAGFDGFDGLTRMTVAENPFGP